MRRAPAPDLHAIPVRARILQAAVQRFARNSYEETGLRDIAADAGVDVAYAHRCFGSKDQLFAQAVLASTGMQHVLAEEPRDLSRHLSAQVFHRDGQATPREIGPLDIIIHSLSSPAASRVVRDCIMREFVAPLGARLDDPAAMRAAVIAALLAGVGILRNVLEIAPLREGAGGDLNHLLATTIAHIGGLPAGAAAGAEEDPDK